MKIEVDDALGRIGPAGQLLGENPVRRGRFGTAVEHRPLGTSY